MINVFETLKKPLTSLRSNLIDPGRDDIVEMVNLEISFFRVGAKSREKASLQSKKKMDMTRE